MVKNGHDTHIDDDPEEKGPHNEGGRTNSYYMGLCGGTGVNAGWGRWDEMGSSPGRPVLGLPALGTTPPTGPTPQGREGLDRFGSLGVLFGTGFHGRSRLGDRGHLGQGLLRDNTLGVGLGSGFDLGGLDFGLDLGLDLDGLLGLFDGGLLELLGGGLLEGGLGLRLGIRGWDFTLGRGRNILFTGDPTPKLVDTVHDTSSTLLMILGFTRGGPTLGSTPALFTVILGRSHGGYYRYYTLR
jgi:hypothetical protein